MARKMKLDNAIQKRRNREQKRKRKTETRELRVHFLIVCEGEKTEPNYFRSFKTNVKKFVHEIDIQGEGSNTKDLVERAIKARDNSSQKYDRVWVVFDKDDFPDDNFNGAISKAEDNDIRAGWTNEAFELWYLLHFQFRDTGMSRTEYKSAIEKAVNKAIEKQSKTKKFKRFKYAKNSNNMYAILEQYGDQEQAIKFAKKLVEKNVGNNFAKHNPGTTVHLLVEELNGNSADLIKEIEDRSS